MVEPDYAMDRDGSFGVSSPYMTLEEAAQYLRLPESSTLLRWAQDREIDYIMYADQYIFSAEILDRFATSRMKSKDRKNGRK